MKAEIEHIVKETNRILYSWLFIHKNDSRFKIAPEDVKSVFNGWFVRFLKTHLGYSECSKLLRYARPIVTLGLDGQIAGVRFGIHNEHFAAMSSYTTKLSLIFREIDYKALAHSAEQEEIRERESKHRGNLAVGTFEPSFEMNLNNLKNIQFV